MLSNAPPNKIIECVMSICMETLKIKYSYSFIFMLSGTNFEMREKKANKILNMALKTI